MIESHLKLQRLADSKVQQYRHEADIARATAAGDRHDWRWRLGETLLAVAGRLSPAHRTLLAKLCESRKAPLSNGKVTV